MKTKMITAAIAMTLSGAALAAPAAPVAPAASAASAASTANEPSGLKMVVQSGQVTVEKTFKTEIKGMTGYLIKQQANGQYAVVMGKDGYLYVGGIIGPDGKNIVKEYSDKFIPQKDFSGIVGKLDKSGGVFAWGKSTAPVAYVFVDPNCIFCNKFYGMAKPLVDAGQLQVKFVLVDFLKPSSEGRAAAIIQAKDHDAAMAQNEAGFIESTEEGGIKPEAATEATKAILKSHTEIMKDAGFNGTPAMIYKENGKWIGSMMQADTLGKIVSGGK